MAKKQHDLMAYPLGQHPDTVKAVMPVRVWKRLPPAVERPIQEAAAAREGIPYRYSDGGRSMSKRPRQSNDCTVRAIALVTGLRFEAGLGHGCTGTHYDLAYDLLAAGGRKSWQGFHLDRWIYGQVDPAVGDPEYILGWTAERIAFPAVKGQRRMNPAAVGQALPQGRFVLRFAGHVAALIDGVIYDTFAPDPDRCIYAAWKFTKVQP